MITGRPKNEPIADAIRIIIRADALGLDIKPVKLGKGVVLSPSQIRMAISRGEKIVIDGAVIDPTILPIKIEYQNKVNFERLSHADPAARLFTRGFITEDMHEAAIAFEQIYARSFPKRNAKAGNMAGGGSGGSGNTSASIINDSGYDKYSDLCRYFKERNRYGAIGHLIQFAYNISPSWINAEKVTWKGRPSNLDISAPKGHERDHSNIVTALLTYVQLMHTGR